MRRATLVGLFVWLVSCSLASADDRGWGYLSDKLIADGVSRERVLETFADARVERFTGLDFSLHAPREPRSLYRGFLRAKNVAAAQRCRFRYADAFETAERMQGVSANLLAAILYVESGCGHSTGSHVVFTRLARLAMANAPENLQRNLGRYADDGGRIDPAVEVQLRARARYLEDTFYPEVRALFAVAARLGVAPLAIRGSTSGAFGAPQFLPTSYLAHGIDADGDGHVSLDDPADAAASCAQYLVQHGWRQDLSRDQRRAVIWKYNRSDAYVDAVLTLAARIGNGSAKPASRTNVATRKHVGRRSAARGNASQRRTHRAAAQLPS